MRILFFTLIKMTSMEDRGIYADMVKEFIKRGHHVDYYFPHSRNFNAKGDNYSLNSILLKQKYQKINNFIFKLFSYVLLDFKLSKIISKSIKTYDLLILVTPSIFQLKIIKSFKKRFPNSKTLLLLKDIFPDNALDLNILNKRFFLFLVYNFFKKIEYKLYNNVDKIGVMTELNKVYILDRFPQHKNKIFISYNSIQFYDIPRIKNRIDLGIDNNKIIITFIGNIGLPQDPIAIKRIIESSSDDVFFIIIGSGAKDFKLANISKTKLLFINDQLDQLIIDQYLINSNYGLILLNSKFKVPNFPSKLLSYLNANLPILAITNENNDLKELIEKKMIVGKWFLNTHISLTKKNLDLRSHIESEIKIHYNIVSQINKLLYEIGVK